MRDLTFGDEFWVSRAALDAEASGNFLVRQSDLVPGWLPLDAATAAQVWGRGVPAGTDHSDSHGGPSCPGGCGGGGAGGGGGGGGGMGPGGGPAFGMAVASIHMMLASILVTDTPVGYSPPVGPSAYFTVRYNQREAFQPQTFYYSNLGAKWTFDWMSYIEDDPSNPAAAVTVSQIGTGRETSTGYSGGTQSYAPTVRRQAVIKRTSSSPIAYERELPDGSVEVFGQPDGASTFPRRVFLTALRDPEGNTLTLTYDASLRVVAATDTIGQVTTIAYEHADPLKITKVTDPFGRYATFAYDAQGRLATITDVIGLQSSFTYGANDALKSMTTPYGTTRFTVGEYTVWRWAEMTDPAGGRERVQYGGGITAAEPSGVLPAGVTVSNDLINHHNTLYWDKKAMATAPGDPASATDYHWQLHGSGAFQATAAPLNIKRPLERRAYLLYQGATNPKYEGTMRRVSAEARVLDDGTTQLTKYEYNSRGRTTKRIDPLGRETRYEYDAGGLRLTAVRQKTGGTTELLETRTYTGSDHSPATVTDAAGQTTTFTYNARGQVLTVTNAKSETTTFAYDTNGYLTSVTGPVAGATTTYAYDAYGRVRTVTDADSYATVTDYDALDRPTRVTYPDATYEETTYRFLDPETRRDRLGRLTRYAYDATRRLTAVQDPLNRVVTQVWCGCGSLDALVDANGNRTRWERDLQGRVTKEVRANGSDTDYVYETTISRLKKVTDAKNQDTNYSYFLDDRLQQISFTNAVIATPSVSFTYDSVYGRVASMGDGIGTTTYGYHAVTTPPGLGATRLASVDGPLANDTITYGYDELGRVTSRAIHGAANTVTWAFDALGRVTSEVNLLGTFTYAYDGVSGRIATVTYPNSQTSTYAYFGNTGDRRLQTIHHQYPNASTLSKFDYTYDAAGNIVTWRQQADTTAVLWEYGYDWADQLTAAVKTSTDPTPAILKRYAYAYDAAGNRVAEQIDDGVTGASYDAMNRLVSQAPAGLLQVEGTVSEAATVTVAGLPALVSATNRFERGIPVVSGTNTVAITATDGSGNAATKTYEIPSSGATKTFTYDANGNMTSDGTRTFEWDAADRIHAITHGTTRHEYSYDGRGQLSRLQKIVGGLTTETSILWADETPVRETTAGTRALYDGGVDDNGSPVFHVIDHRLAPVALTNISGAIGARFETDPDGEMVLAGGTGLPPWGIGGLHLDPAMGIAWGHYRAYVFDPGRWASEDPFGYADGPNLYMYGKNNPIKYVDPTGAAAMAAGVGRALGVAGACVIGAGLDVKRHHNERNNRYAHCLASCLITKGCPGGSASAWLAGAGKEVIDVIRCALGRQASCDSAVEKQDLIDNAFGRSCPKSVTCADRCKPLRDVPDRR